MNARRTTMGAISALAWLALIVDASPWGFDMADDLSRLLLTVAGVGTVVLGLAASSRPVDEVYLMGVEAGRRMAKVERAAERAKRSRVVVPFRRLG